MTPTPRTDAEQERIRRTGICLNDIPPSPDFARQLERELAEAKAGIAVLEKAHEPLAQASGSVTCGGPPIDWKQKHDDLIRHISAMEAAASILHDRHRNSGHCERPNTCGGCHFWSGAREAAHALRVGDKSTIKKALMVAATVKDSLSVASQNPKLTDPKDSV